MGYENVREYHGGMEEWIAAGLPVESAPHAAATPRSPGRASTRSTLRSMPRGLAERLLERVGVLSLGGLLTAWVAIVVVSGVFYWVLDAAGLPGLVEHGQPVPGGLSGLVHAVYFSFVTVTSIGFGDIVPAGTARVVAILEAAAGLLMFGIIISKLVSRRQEQLTEEIHRTTFEDRLGRIRTNLHLVLSELQTLESACAQEVVSKSRLRARVESTATVFTGELRTIHDLLYRPQQVPDEDVLQAMLASVAAVLCEFGALLERVPGTRDGSPILAGAFGSMRRLAGEICGECVPREYAPDLKVWMDEIQALSEGLAARR